MLLPILLALAAPPAFVHAVEARIAPTHMHVADWWAADLDDDHIPESIALVCNADRGSYLVQHGSQLLEAELEIDGRNNCPDAPATPPPWLLRSTRTIDETINVHHGRIGYSLAVRDGQLVIVGEDSDGFDVVRDGGRDEEGDLIDYDALTWSHTRAPAHARKVVTTGLVLAVTDRPRRPTTLTSTATMTATRIDDEHMTLHIHATRALIIEDCGSTPCHRTTLSAGDHEVPMAMKDELTFIAGRRRFALHLVTMEGELSYPLSHKM